MKNVVIYDPGKDSSPWGEKTLVFADDIVPPEHSWMFCQKDHIRLIMLNSDHRLISKLPVLSEEFDRFLVSLLPS